MRKLFYFVSGTSVYLSLAFSASAQQNINPCKNVTGIAVALCGLGDVNTAKTLQNIIVFFVVLAVIIALLYLLYGGIKWITSRGEKTEVEAARNHIIAAIVGLIVVFLAVFLVTVVLGAFDIKLTELMIPKIIPGSGGSTGSNCVPACSAGYICNRIDESSGNFSYVCGL